MHFDGGSGSLATPQQLPAQQGMGMLPPPGIHFGGMPGNMPPGAPTQGSRACSTALHARIPAVGWHAFTVRACLYMTPVRGLVTKRRCRRAPQ